MLSTLNQLLETAFVGKLFNINQNCPPEKNLDIDLTFNPEVDRDDLDVLEEKIEDLVFELKTKNTKLTVKSVKFITICKNFTIRSIIQIEFEEYSEFTLEYDLEFDLFFEDKNN